MATFTIETSYMLPVYKHRVIEAPTLEEACALALEDDDWEGQKECFDGSGPTFIDGAWSGPQAYPADAALYLTVPDAFTLKAITEKEG